MDNKNKNSNINKSDIEDKLSKGFSFNDLNMEIMEAEGNENLFLGKENGAIEGKELQTDSNSIDNLNENIIIHNPLKASIIKNSLLHLKEELESLINMLGEINENVEENKFKIIESNELIPKKLDNHITDEETIKVIEGIFFGQDMVAKDGSRYGVPANYASKSKLVEGDLLKLRILKDGTFRYKQIEKVERINLMANLIYEENSRQYYAIVDDIRRYKVLAASITYFKAKSGDDLLIITPKSMVSEWAAVENISRRQV